jgi:CheY-like chemotaxis protein
MIHAIKSNSCGEHFAGEAGMTNLEYAAVSEHLSHAESLGTKPELSAGSIQTRVRAGYRWLCDSFRKSFRVRERVDARFRQPTPIEIDLHELHDTTRSQIQEEPVLDAVNHESFAPPRGAETVLVVDDQPLVRGYMVTMLRELGYTVLEAASGAEALHIVRTNCGQHIRLVLTDMIMPKMGGRELGYRAGLLCPEVKMLFCSNYPETLAIRNGMIDERTPYVQKPVTRDALARKVRQVLDQATEDLNKRSPTPNVHV